ncbi:uncharacterized protein LOC129745632 isoform X2 [Uranotaenia lowii]|uniref:uncharacterized protein LOC129745632 isoform X2 n=1 Tax=Uranotaenia lowii TaxID=190385 RepID=UPI00247ABFF4|nr:uncharacterized protein LOC129745632 isoform X2 [Uranotaenia lowii]
MEFEEVEMEEDYLIEGDISDASPVKTSHEPAPKVARLVPKSEPSTSGRKIPIIRSAGAVVTPVRTAIRKPVQAPPSTDASLRKVNSPISSSISPVVAEPELTTDAPPTQGDRLTVIENKLALIVQMMQAQDDAIRKLVIPLKKLQADCAGETRKKYHTFADGDGSDSSLDEEEQPEEREFKSITYVHKMVTNVQVPDVQKQNTKGELNTKGECRVEWPVVDTNDLWRLEEALVNEDLRVRTKLCELFDLIPPKDLYTYLRMNIRMLFRNTEKFTWSGKTTQICNNTPNRTPARSLKTVCLLMDWACQNFPEYNRKMIESTCQRAMRCLNDTVRSSNNKHKLTE